MNIILLCAHTAFIALLCTDMHRANHIALTYISGMHNLRPAGRIRPSNVLYQALGADLKTQETSPDGEFMNEFGLHWTIHNFVTYYNPKQLSCNNIKPHAIRSNKSLIFILGSQKLTSEAFCLRPLTALNIIRCGPWAKEVVHLCYSSNGFSLSVFRTEQISNRANWFQSINQSITFFEEKKIFLM